VTFLFDRATGENQGSETEKTKGFISLIKCKMEDVEVLKSRRHFEDFFFKA